MEQQTYNNGGFTSGIYCKIVKPVMVSGVNTSIDSRDLISTETILENKTKTGGLVIFPEGGFTSGMYCKTVFGAISLEDVTMGGIKPYDLN